MSSVVKGPRVGALAAALALSLTVTPAFAGKAHVEGLRSNESYNRFIVKYRDGSEALSSSSVLAASLTNAAGKAIPVAKGKGKSALAVRFKRNLALKRAKLIESSRVLDSVEAAQLMRQIASDPNVEWIQPDLLMSLTSDDTRWGDQWDMQDSAVGVRAPSAWTTSTGANVVVAVVDSGKLAHDDLNANYLAGYDFVTSTTGAGLGCVLAGLPSDCGASEDGDGRDNDPTDSSNIKHGTHVAGTIGAVANNNLGVAGVAPGAKIVPIRVMGKAGNGATADIVDGILWASGEHIDGVPDNQNRAHVINLSLGGARACSETPAYQDAIDTAVANGAIVVVAAGNSNTDVSGFTPASCDDTVTVASSDNSANRAWYSNYGATIDITAPGGETCSPATEFLALGEAVKGKCTQNHLERGILSTIDDDGYGYMQGTSMAAPHIAGIVALMRSAAGVSLSTQDVLDALESTARPISAAKCPGGCGPGLVDAEAAVELIAGDGGGNPPANTAPVANFTSSATGLTVNFTDTSTDSDGSIASRAWTFGDGTSSTSANPSKTYSAAGTYSVKLTVTDDDGATHSVTKSVTVSASSSNQAPVANFTSSVSNLTASFTDTSTDSDGSIASRSWDFGDATSSTLANPSHTYAAAGTYTVKLTVTDNNGATNTKTGSVTVTAASSGTQTYSNDTDVAIPNFGSGISSIEVSERAGKASSTTAVRVEITHPYPSHLSIKLIAPDGTSSSLLLYTQGTAASLDKTYTVNLSTKDLNGTWKLDVRDFTGGTVGTIDSWSITF